MNLSHYDSLSRAAVVLEASLARSADLIIANSYAGMRYAVSKGFDVGRIRVVDNGIECDHWRRDARAGARFRETHGIPAHAPLVGLVGRLDPMKGHDVFFRAMAKLRELREDVQIAVIGSGAVAFDRSLHELGSAILGDDSIRWIPEQADLVPVYSSLDVLVSASSGEGFPNVVAEALACDARVVVTDVGDSARLVGEDGRVVPAGDAEAMSKAIEVALQPRPSGPPYPHERIRAQFGVDVMVDRTEALLLTLVGSARASGESVRAAP